MNAMKRFRFGLLLVAFAVLIAACGGDDEPAATTAAPTTEAPTTEAPATTEAPVTTTTEAITETTEAMGFEALYDGELTIGYVLPQTGGLSVIIDALAEAVNMAFAEMGDAGNTAIRLIPTDSGTDAQVASGAVEQLINDEVDAIIGPASTGISLSVIDRITGSEIPMCSPSNTGAIFTTYDDGGYYFRTAPPDNLQGQVHADLITDERCIERRHRIPQR